MENLLMKKLNPKKSKNTKSSYLGTKALDQVRRKYGACDHNRVSYKALEHLNELLWKRIDKDGRTLRKIGTLIDSVKFHKDIIEYQKNQIDGMEASYQEQFDSYIEANKELKEQNTDLILYTQKLKEKMYGKFSIKTWRNRPNKKEDN